MTRRIIVVLAGLLAISISASTQSPEWNQWRGAKRDGVTPFSVPSAWPERPTQVWKVDAGIGHSSPVVAAGRVYLLSRVGEQEAVTAYDASSGKQVWRQTYDAPYQVNPAATSHGKGPKSTPLVDRGRVYAFGIGGILSAFDAATGKVLWRNDFKKDFPVTAALYGTAVSPMVDGELLIVHAGGPGSGAIVALDRTTGTQKWAWKDDAPAYASPIVASFGGTRQLITQTEANLVAISPVDGRLLWKIPFATEYKQNIITPVVSGDLVIYGGVAKPTTAVRIGQQAGAWTPAQVWQNAGIPMYMSSPVLSRGVLYGLTQKNRGQFFAVDAKTGKTLWTSPPRQGENAALTLAGDVIIATTTEGALVVLKQGTTEFAQLKKYTLSDSPIWAHPAFTANGIVVKDAETLSLWRFQ